jgi:threonylcarbamoyladenosine tRNA methylthiotransferase MtaB
MPLVALHTFGCKINQYETQGMGEALVRAGYALARDGEGADLHVVNTCTVTESADAQCRRLVRRIVRDNPGARVVVTGCYAQRDPETVAGMPGVALVVGQGEKGRIAEILRARLARGRGEPRGGAAIVREPAGGRRLAYDETPVSRFDRTTRAAIKVQDGCDGHCGFCVIPEVRGRSRSRTAEAVLEEATRLIGAGYLEIVLSGVHLGSWRDPRGRARLDALVGRLIALPGLRRLRLSSLEPQHLTERLLDLAASPALMPFFHLPLQSGDDATLRRMRRGYTTRHFAEKVARLVARRPEVGIGSDVLVGYPGEDAASFERSLRFVEAMPFTRLHVFPYSPRLGTEAVGLADSVPDAEKRERAGRMRAISDAKAAAFEARFVGTHAEVLVESRRTAQGRLAGYTGNYIRAELPGDGALANRIVTVSLHEGRRGLRGIPIEAAA